MTEINLFHDQDYTQKYDNNKYDKSAVLKNSLSG